MPQPSDTAGHLRTRAYLARERLSTGQSQAAIDEFEELQPQLLQVDLRLTPDVRVLLGLSYMRLGEQENCLARHATVACLLPIGSDGIHAIERGSRAARAEFAAYLAEHPDDLTVRWLLQIPLRGQRRRLSGAGDRGRASPPVPQQGRRDLCRAQRGGGR